MEQLLHAGLSALGLPTEGIPALERFGEILYEKFQPEALDAQIDAWVQVIGPLIPAQHERWKTGDMEAWNDSVATLRKLCKERPAKVVEHITKTLSLSNAEVKKYFDAFLDTTK